MVSHHWDRDNDYNERNHGIGCRDAVGRWDVLLFRNSDRRHSVMITDYKPVYQFNRLTIGYDYGIVSGYSLPVVILPRARLDFGRIRINSYLLMTQGIAVGFEFDL